MDFSELSTEQRTALCSRLDLAEDATDEQITTALTETPESEEKTEETPEEKTTEEETPEEKVETPEETKTETPAEETTTPVDSTVLSQLQADAAEGRKAREQQVTEHRESVLTAALKDGKITPASKGAWESKLKAAPQATEDELAALPADLVPVKEVGHGGSQTSEAVVTEADMAAMFPGHATRKAAA